MEWSEKYKKSIDCNNPKGFSQKAHCQGRKKKNETTMKLSELKEVIREISRNKFYESLNEISVQPGSSEYVNLNDSDETILDIAKQYIKFPHSRLKTNGVKLQKSASDLGKLLGYPTKPGELLQYDNSGVPYLDKNKLTFNKNKAPLWKMFKSGKLSQKEYKDIVTPLIKNYWTVAKLWRSYLYLQNVPAGSRAAKAAAMRDMG